MRLVVFKLSQIEYVMYILLWQFYECALCSVHYEQYLKPAINFTEQKKETIQQISEKNHFLTDDLIKKN